MRFVVLFIPSFSDRPAGALTTISSSSQSCVIAKPLLFADELPASGGTPKHLSLPDSSDLLDALPRESQPGIFSYGGCPSTAWQEGRIRRECQEGRTVLSL